MSFGVGLGRSVRLIDVPVKNGPNASTSYQTINTVIYVRAFLIYPVMPLRYLLHFAQVHNDFRLSELQSVAELYGIPYALPPQVEDRDPTRPFMVIGLEREEHARILAKRCILIKCVLNAK